MTDQEKKALADRLRGWAREYEKIASRASAIAGMVADMRAAANELSPEGPTQ